MTTGVAQLKYGYIKGGEVSIDGYWTAAQTVRQQSGRFVYLDGAGRCTLSADAVTTIWGHADYPGDDAVSADDPVNVNISLDAIYRIPVNSGVYVKAMIGDTCDISIDGTTQGAQLDASAENTLLVVGGDLVSSAWVDVKINPAKMVGTGDGVED